MNKTMTWSADGARWALIETFDDGVFHRAFIGLRNQPENGDLDSLEQVREYLGTTEAT